MLAVGALALSWADVASFSPPPHRPRRPERRTKGSRGVVRVLIHALRRELARATTDPAPGSIPRLARRYPY